MGGRRAFLELPAVGDDWRPSQLVPLLSDATVGRDPDNVVIFSDPMVSLHHAEFRHVDGSVHLVDLNSTNGTYVNNARVHGQKVLKDGDVVMVGRSTLVFHQTDRLVDLGGEAPDGVVRSEVYEEKTTRTTRKAVDVADLVYEDRALGAVCQVANALVAQRSLPELFDKVLEAILDSIPAQRTAILLFEGDSPVPVMKAMRTRGDAESGPLRLDFVQRAMEGRKAYLIRDAFEDSDLRDAVATHADPIRSVMCAPLWSTSKGKTEGRALGWVYLDSQSDRPPLTDRDFHILIMMANITATKIENTRLLEESRQKERMEEDMRVAAEIQSDLLPRRSPSIDGYRVCGTTDPCRMVGGDYYDFEYDGRHLFMALADVSGKGTGAAMLMVALRATVRAHWRDGALHEATARMNRTFQQTVPPDKYATFFLARLDSQSGLLEYVNAGHNRPLLVHPDGQWCRLDVGGTVLGAFAEAVYRQGTVLLEPGACLVVFSDGISDAWRDHDEADRQLIKLIQARKVGDVAALRGDIFNAAVDANDDRTLIVLERLKAEPPKGC